MTGNTFARVAISVATTSAVSVAICYIFGARRKENNNQAPRNNKKLTTKTTKPGPADNKAPSVVNIESDEESDIRIINTSDYPCDDEPQNQESTDSSSRSHPAGVFLHVCENREERAVILYTTSEEPAELKGIISPEQGIMHSDGVLGTLCEVKDETCLLTLSLKDEGDVIEADTEQISTLNSSLLTIPESEGLQCYAKEKGVVASSSSSGKPGEDFAALRRHHLDDSDAVIMISAEDWTMMEQLLLQMYEDEELFDCGDEFVPYNRWG